MSLSVFDIFKIGIGPSSSHTMGPMNAARSFVELLAARDLLSRTTQVSAQLYGSLAFTGRGHCTDRAILLGLEGMSPDTIDPPLIEPTLQRIRVDGPHPSVGTARDRLRRAAQSPVPHRSGAAGTLQRHALHCARCGAARCWRARSITASAAASSCKPAPRRTPARPARSRRTSSIPAARLLEHGAQEGLEIHELDAGARAHLVQRRRNSRAAHAHLAGHAGLRAPRLRGPGTCCRACSACGGARRSSTAN